MQFSDTVIQAFLVTLIQVMLPIVLGVLGVLLKTWVDQLKMRMGKEQFDFAVDLAHRFVLAAEQTGLSGTLAAEGSDKKKWVLDRLESELEKRGINIDIHILSDLVESAVFTELSVYKPK